MGTATMRPIETGHIGTDERGVAYIAGTRHKVTQIALDHLAQGWDANQTHAQFPDLSLAQIHSALSYYFDNSAKLDAEMTLDEQYVEAFRADVEANTPLASRSELIARLFTLGIEQFAMS